VASEDSTVDVLLEDLLAIDTVVKRRYAIAT